MRTLLLAVAILPACLAVAQAAAPEAFVEHATISADGRTVWFAAHGDIWSMPADGGTPANRLTDNVAYEDMPVLSPDGSLVAFQSERFGSIDVFVMPAEGGEATRLTWHSYPDHLLGWQPDGRALLVSSLRDDWPAPSLWRIPLDGGQPERITGPDQDDNNYADFTGDGAIIYARGPGYDYRKRHRGSDSYDLWRFDMETGRHSEFVRSPGRDSWPQVDRGSGTLFFVSDRDGTDNIFSMPLAGGQARQLTHYTDDGPQFLRLSPDADELVFSVFGSLHVMQLADGSERSIPVRLKSEGKHADVVEQTVRNDVEELAVSPDGKYFALIVNSDLHLLKNPDSYPEDAKPDQDLSMTIPLLTSAGRERSPNWHHDGRRIAYLSDRNGQFDVFEFDLESGEERQLTDSPVDEGMPRWSPVDDRLLYLSGNHDMQVLDTATGESLQLQHAEFRIGPFGDSGYWSPDGAWIAYSVAPVWWSADVFVMPSGGGDPVNISMTPDNEGDPVWSPDGRFLGFSFSSSDDYSNEFGSRARLLLLEHEEQHYDPELLFEEDRINPEDETAADEEASAEDAEQKPEEDGDAAAGDEEEAVEPVQIDFTEIENRAETIPPWGGDASFRLFSPDGSVAYIVLDDGGDNMLAAVDTESLEMEVLGPAKLRGMQITADGKRIYGLVGGSISYLDIDGMEMRGGGSIASSSSVVQDRFALRRQSFNEMWRILRDNFYDKGLHGTDWQVVKRKYEPLLESVPTGEEYTMLMNRMVGELAASHSWFFSPDGSASNPQATGSLGIELDPDYNGPGWRVASVLYGSPAWQRGSELFPGDVILSVNGDEVGAGTQRERMFNNTVGELLVLDVQNGEQAMDWLAAKEDAPEEIAPTRQVSIIPEHIGRLFGAKYEAWVRHNREAVDELGSGRIGYQHIEGMDYRSLARFRRELYTLNHDKDALIIDVRFNGGGDIYAQLYDILTNKVLFHSKTRFEQWRDTPEWQWHGPIVVLINAWSYSDAEDFAHMMQEQGMATIVGEDTGGNLIAVAGVGLADGSFFGLPMEGWWRLDGRNMEGFGCPADVPVEIDPNALAEGRDNQLEVAVRTLIEQLGDDSAH
ncbi:MAG: PD40 domain-containing protein [Planctomycetales bacterium]|nr:PD40 domain-containing protein [bacterium]UNM07025.1 MAG: PD40 domain-containing protein [Planctomycetales bacterium]